MSWWTIYRFRHFIHFGLSKLYRFIKIIILIANDEPIIITSPEPEITQPYKLQSKRINKNNRRIKRSHQNVKKEPIEVSQPTTSQQTHKFNVCNKEFGNKVYFQTPYCIYYISTWNIRRKTFLSPQKLRPRPPLQWSHKKNYFYIYVANFVGC